MKHTCIYRAEVLVHKRYSSTVCRVRGNYKWCERSHKFVGKNRSHHL